MQNLAPVTARGKYINGSLIQLYVFLKNECVSKLSDLMSHFSRVCAKISSWNNKPFVMSHKHHDEGAGSPL